MQFVILKMLSELNRNLFHIINFKVKYMSKQIRFFQTKSEEAMMFEEFIRIGLNVYLEASKYSSYERQIEASKPLDCVQITQWSQHALLLLTTSNLFREERFIKRLCPSPDPAIEFSRCLRNRINENSMEYARFWVDSQLCSNTELLYYYNKLVKYIKKNYFYCKALMCYIGRDTLEQWKRGECTLHQGTSVFQYEKFMHI